MTLRSALLAGVPLVIVGCSLTASLDDLTAGGAAGTAGATGGAQGGTTAAGAAGANAGGAGKSGAAAGAAGAAAKSGAAGAAGAAGRAGMAGAGAGGAGAPGGTGGSTVAGAAGVAGSAATEICTNGKDDDGDGKIDCADPDCSTMACVASGPSGWSGPFVFYVGAKGSEPPCAGAFTDALVPPTSAPAATCSACSCEPPTGGVCLIATVTAFASAGCTGAQQDQPLGTPNQCFPIQNGVGNDYFRTEPVEAQGATCAPAGGAATLAPAISVIGASVLRRAWHGVQRGRGLRAEGASAVEERLLHPEDGRRRVRRAGLPQQDAGHDTARRHARVHALLLRLRDGSDLPVDDEVLQHAVLWRPAGYRTARWRMRPCGGNGRVHVGAQRPTAGRHLHTTRRRTDG